MDLNYKCDYSPNSDYLIVRDASDDADDSRLSFVARADDLTEDCEVLLSKQDALDLAWSVLEHYGVATRPEEPIDEGDFIKVTQFGHPCFGFLGRVVQSRNTGDHQSIRITDLSGEHRWIAADYCKRLSPAEFGIEAHTRITEIMREF